MAEVLVKFAEPVLSAKRTLYAAQASGAEMRDGRWEGWIEFTPLGGGPPVRSPRETTRTEPARHGLLGIRLDGNISGRRARACPARTRRDIDAADRAVVRWAGGRFGTV